MMGLYPRDSPGGFEYVPSGLEEAREFYQTYARLNYTADFDSESVLLEADSALDEKVQSIASLLPKILRFQGQRRSLRTP